MAAGRKATGDHGATLVEFALLLPVLALLILGGVTGGLALSRQNSVNNAVREATRFGAVFSDFDDTADNLDALYAHVVAAATGDLDAGVPDREVCVALLDGATWAYQAYTSADTPTASGSGPAGSGPTECTEDFVDVGPTTKRIWVRTSRTSRVSAVLYSSDWVLEARSLTRYER